MSGDSSGKILDRILMYDKVNLLLKNRYLPRWVVFSFDLFVVVTAFFLSYSLRYNFSSMPIDPAIEFRQVITVLAVYLASFIAIRPFTGILRHTTSHDIQRLFKAVLLSSLSLTAITLLSRRFFPLEMINVPVSVIIIHGMVTVTLLTFSRIVIKYIFLFMTRLNQEPVQVVIYGAGDLGQDTRLAMERSVHPSYKVVGFIDSKKSLQGKSRSGIYIFSPAAAISRIFPRYKVKILVVAISDGKILKNTGEKVLDYCLENKIEIRKVPPVSEWINGSFEARQIRRIAIDDLLGREEIKLSTDRIQKELEGKTILVTGAAGSIGSEIVRQLISFETRKIILLDQAESPLYDLQIELHTKYNGRRDFDVVIADVSNRQRLKNVFDLYHPEIIFNAAAYKHVPLLEDNVCEAVRVNVGGTKLLADMASQYGVQKFVMISSDKAVNPTNVMGATKRICELYVQSLVAGNGTSTQFITTRFGNVLGSNGSVVPLFTKQIEAGGPVTLTHKDMKRYFMTIPEACQLVLEAGFMGQGGEIYLFDMGEPVRIYDLAVKMISLAGLEAEKDIKIIETGLRPGEKLFEEMLADKENHLPTYHPKILIANMRNTNPPAVKEQVEELLSSAMTEPEQDLVNRIRRLVPEFEPQNGKFRGDPPSPAASVDEVGNR